MTDLTIPELTDDLLAWARDLPYPKRGESPLWRWQRWMRERPSDAWAVMNELVARAPADSEVMDHVARNAPNLIGCDFDRFMPLVAQLLPASPLLASMVGEEIFVRGYYGPRYRNLEELAAVWVYHSRHTPNGLKLREIIEGESAESLRVALEIIDRGPLHGFDTDDVDGPLLDCLRHHAPLVIQAIEEAASDSVAVRRAIWSARRLNPAYDGEHAVPPPLWKRFQNAARSTTTYNTRLPPGTRNPLEAHLETIVEAWFHLEESSWASWEVDRSSETILKRLG